MSARRVSVLVLVVLFLACLGAIRIEQTTNVRSDGTTFIAVGLIPVWSFVLAGLIAWRRRPSNRTGPLMVLIGFAWLCAALTDASDDTVFTIGLVLSTVWPALLIHLLLSYPSGELDHRSRILVVAAYIDTLGVGLLALPFLEPRLDVGGTSSRSAHNLLLLSHQHTFVQTLAAVSFVAAIAIVIGTLIVVVQRWRAASAATRRVLAPMYVTGGAAILVLVFVFSAFSLVGSNDTQLPFYIFSFAFAAMPVGYLLGILRTRLDRSTAVETLLETLRAQRAPGGVRDALRVALNDPTLDLAYRRDDGDGYLDVAGQPSELPQPDGRRAVTAIEHDGETMAALVHDPFLLDDPGLIDAVCGTAALAIANERLSAGLRAQAVELRASRARIVAAGDAERRRLERNLHDGAQQRLVSLALALRMARSALAEPEQAARLLDDAGRELGEALAELRELARGIHPAVLTDQGLRVALESVCARTQSVPVDLTVELQGDPPAAEAAAVYYVVAEALTNVVRYADATRAEVAVTAAADVIRVEVRDDGVGGAAAGPGSGLRGLADRVEALGGRLEVRSEPGQGTVVAAQLPLAATVEVAPQRAGTLPG